MLPPAPTLRDRDKPLRCREHFSFGIRALRKLRLERLRGRTVCETRNALFKHLKTCEDAARGKIRPAEADPPIECLMATDNGVIDFEEICSVAGTKFKLTKAPAEMTKQFDDNPMSSFIHLKFKCRATPNGEN
ncbi:hypothetical protein QBC44DRAFT_372416 [Cladorrhinum sp. PSN332]|nr:hypothetical protein QBC44DRAFT_372416 [Cladorrhinum sp. PSN332]